MADSNQVRINELARELEIKAKVLIEFLPEVGVTEKKTHSSSIDLQHAELVRKHFRDLAAAEEAAEADKTARATAGKRPAAKPAVSAPAAAPSTIGARPAAPAVPAKPATSAPQVSPAAPGAARPSAPVVASPAIRPAASHPTSAPPAGARPAASPAAPASAAGRPAASSAGCCGTATRRASAPINTGRDIGRTGSKRPLGCVSQRGPACRLSVSRVIDGPKISDASRRFFRTGSGSSWSAARDASCWRTTAVSSEQRTANSSRRRTWAKTWRTAVTLPTASRQRWSRWT